MTVREAAPGEHAEIRELLTTAYAQYAPAVGVRALFDHYLAGVTDLAGSDDHRDDHRDGRMTLLVAESAGRIAGTARLYAPGAVPYLPAGWAWVRAVAVRPDLRGTGIARELMADCRRRASEDGATTLCLHTIDFMPDAIRLYERLGYTRAPEQDIDIAEYYRVGGHMIGLAYRLTLKS
jgi:GNAT superfamily N-acetyltransferase